VTFEFKRNHLSKKDGVVAGEKQEAIRQGQVTPKFFLPNNFSLFGNFLGIQNIG